MESVIVFGAAGRTGLRIVDYALSAGHSVTAFVRAGTDYPLSHPLLSIYNGDALDGESIAAAIPSHHIVISALGTQDIDGPAVNMMADAMALILPAMRANSIHRVLAIGGLGVLQADETTQLLDQVGYPAQFLHVGRGHNRVYHLLRDSGMDWTMVCCPYIPDADRTGHYQTQKDYPAVGANQIGTGDLADFIVQEMTANQYLRSRVGISN